jgi:hypothetical protein
MALKRSILEFPITLCTQAEIAAGFWGRGTFELAHLGPYFQYYADQSRIVFQSYKSQFPLKTHGDIVDIAADILSHVPRSAVIERLANKYTALDGATESSLEACVDLTVRLVFMLDVGEFLNAWSGRRKLVWSSGPIQSFMRQLFPSKLPLSHDGLKLGRDFTVCNMVRIAGFKIELTTNIADHLRLRDADRTVAIFHHASFLKSQRLYERPCPVLMYRGHD